MEETVQPEDEKDEPQEDAGSSDGLGFHGGKTSFFPIRCCFSKTSCCRQDLAAEFPSERGVAANKDFPSGRSAAY
jgi:hypothetical protein